MRQFSLRQPFTSFSQQSCTNYTEGNCEFCVRACFFLSFECVHARSRDQSLHLLFFCCHIKSDCLHRLSPFVFRSRSRCRNFPSATCPASRCTTFCNPKPKFYNVLNQHPTILQNIRHPVTLPLQSQRYCFRSPVSNSRPAQCRRKTPNFKP